MNDARLGGYALHYGSSPGDYNAQIEVGNTTNYTVAGLNAGNTYFFGVRAYSQDKSLWSDLSNEISATIGAPDTDPPAVSITSSPAGPTYTSAQVVTISAAATDDQGVTRVEFYDGTTLKGTDTTSPYSYAWGFSGADNGTHNWTAKAYDAAGNIGTSSALSRIVETDDIPLGVVAAYGFEETGGTSAMDASGNGNDGVISGAIRTTAGRFGDALSFDGLNDRIDLGALDIEGGDGLTVSVWMKADDFGTYDARLVSKATGVYNDDHYWMLSTFTNNSVRFRLKAGGSTTTLISNSGVIAAGQWHHVAATYDGLRMRLYVDGVEVGLTAKTGAVNTNSNVPAGIGDQPQGAQAFDGLIDEVRLYNRALTVQQLQTDMATPVGTLISQQDTTPPAISITTSPAGPTYTSAQTVVIPATATDTVGVTRVEFYDGTTLRGTDSTSPYSYAWEIAVADNGSHTWTAKAYDAAGNVGTSSALNRTVNIAPPTPAAPAPPAPVADFTASTTSGNAPLTVIFSDNSSPDVTSRSWNFGDGGTSIAETAVYTYTAAGTYNVSLTVTGTGGSDTETKPGFVVVTSPDTEAPAISITTSPAGPTYTSAQVVTISAAATDDRGVTRVEFYDGTTLKGTDTTSPYSYAWGVSGADNGTHSWTAKAYDDAGNIGTSSALSRIVATDNNPLGVVAAYGFEETGGTTAMDASGNGNDGIISGAIRTTAGRFGDALSFDGVDDRIDLGALDIDGGDGLTLSVWMKADDFGTYDARLVSKATGVNNDDHYWMLSTFTNNSVRFRLKAGGSTTTLISNSWVITTGQWHHVTATYDGLRMRLYVDGVEVGSAAKTGVVDTNGSVPAGIGDQPQGAKAFDGLIDEVRLYNRALTAQQIQTDMLTPVGAPALELEMGELVVDDEWQRVDFEQPFVDAIVVANALSANASDPAVVRVDGIDANGFWIQVQEWDYLDGFHSPEVVSYLVMERGRHKIADGSWVEAGRLQTSSTNAFDHTVFEDSFEVTPIVLTAVTSVNEDDTVTSRIRNIDPDGFQFGLREQEANAQSHAVETIDYIAWEPSSGVIDGLRYEVNRTADEVTHLAHTIVYQSAFEQPPVFLANMQSTDGGDTANLRWQNKTAGAVDVWVDEEQSRDSEIRHTKETVGYFLLEFVD